MSNINKLRLDYELIDSGESARLERFGSTIISRPATVAGWKRRNDSAWSKAEIIYDGKQWNRNIAPWNIHFGEMTLQLSQQENGQIGIFPEHALYLPRLTEWISTSTKVLNLFAYTGMATLCSIKCGAAVVHVDMANHALQWLKQNITLSKLSDRSLRIIKEDALAFIKREIRRDNKYDIILCDPPSFSRYAKGQYWNVEDILPSLFADLKELLNPKGTLLFTTHAQLPREVFFNLAVDAFPDSEIKAEELYLTEDSTKIGHNYLRRFPAGYLLVIRLK